MWERDLAEVKARPFEQDVAGAVERVREWRWADPFSEFFVPLPPVARDPFRAYGGWRERDERADAVGFDELGRPVVHLLDRERAKYVWSWDDDGSFLEFALVGPHVRRARVADGALVHVATWRAGIEASVQLLTWQHDRAVRAVEASVTEHYWGWAQARVAEYGADGGLARIRAIREEGPADVAACLELAAGLRPEAVVWDARVEAPEPWPGAAAALARAEPLAVALDGALRAAAADADVRDPFLLEVFAGGDFKALFPPAGRLVGAQWRDRMRRSSSRDGAALSESHKAADAGVAADLALVDRLDDEALRTCRMLSSAYYPTAPRSLAAAADPVADAVGDHLARLLNASPLAGAASPFLAAVFVGASHYGQDRFARTRAAVGKQRFAEFLASLSSTKPRGGAARKLREETRRALQDRDALEALLASGGLPEHATRLAHEVVEQGLLLLPARDVPARSRLGGTPLLPAGEPSLGRLTFLAGIDLAELPPTRLPSEGWLLFYADLGTGEGDGLVDEAPNEPGSVARVFWTGDPVEVAGPALDPRPVVAHPFLTLPDTWTAGEALSLDVYARQTYEELAERLAAALPKGDGRHWMGGHATGAQGVPLDTGSVLLLSMQDDPGLGFGFLDAGTVQFRIPPDALARRDFARVVAYADSC